MWKYKDKIKVLWSDENKRKGFGGFFWLDNEHGILAYRPENTLMVAFYCENVFFFHKGLSYVIRLQYIVSFTYPLTFK